MSHTIRTKTMLCSYFDDIASGLALDKDRHNESGYQWLMLN